MSDSQFPIHKTRGHTYVSNFVRLFRTNIQRLFWVYEFHIAIYFAAFSEVKIKFFILKLYVLFDVHCSSYTHCLMYTAPHIRTVWCKLPLIYALFDVHCPSYTHCLMYTAPHIRTVWCTLLLIYALFDVNCPSFTHCLMYTALHIGIVWCTLLLIYALFDVNCSSYTHCFMYTAPHIHTVSLGLSEVQGDG